MEGLAIGPQEPLLVKEVSRLGGSAGGARALSGGRPSEAKAELPRSLHLPHPLILCSTPPQVLHSCQGISGRYIYLQSGSDASSGFACVPGADIPLTQQQLIGKITELVRHCCAGAACSVRL